MGKADRDARRDSEAGESPYRNLYIYQLNGQLDPSEEEGLGGAFIGRWVEDDSSFLFFEKPANETIARLLNQRPSLSLIDDYHFTYDQWQGGEPDVVRVENFLITPPWMKSRPDDGITQIVLDPGVVFGNGFHPTTRDCLRALAFAQKHRPFTNVLDLGTGTGILALAGALLGARQVLAVDLNPLCVKTARKNVELNGLEGTIEVMEGPAESFLDRPADLVVANMHHGTLQAIAKSRVFCSRERMIVSGLMRSQAGNIRAVLEKRRMRIVREWDHNMTWYTILAEKD